MFTFSQLEAIAATGGYEPGNRNIGRITVAEVHKVHIGLHNSRDPQAQLAVAAATRLRRWLLRSEGRLPPVRGAGFVHSNREVWMAYPNQEYPAIVRGKASSMMELRGYLAMGVSPMSASIGTDYFQESSVRTDPPISVEKRDGIILRSPLGVLALTMPQAQEIKNWLSLSLQPRDKRAVLFLPFPWQPDPRQQNPPAGR